MEKELRKALEKKLISKGFAADGAEYESKNAIIFITEVDILRYTQQKPWLNWDEYHFKCGGKHFKFFDFYGGGKKGAIYEIQVL